MTRRRAFVLPITPVAQDHELAGGVTHSDSPATGMPLCVYVTSITT